MKIRIQNWPPPPSPEGGRMGSPLATLCDGGRSASLHADETTGELALRSAGADGEMTYHPVGGVIMFGDFGATLDGDGARFLGGALPPRAVSAEGRLDGDDARPIAMSVENGFWLAAIPADARDAFIRFRAQDGSVVQDCYIQPDAPIPVGGGFIQKFRNIFRQTPRGSATFVGESR